jgi:peptide/nickel transport system substrate-binding protein/oligopeptide transport system substrate-binding protein
MMSLLPVVVVSTVLADTTPRYGGVYRRPLANEPASLDPARTRDIYAYAVMNQIYDGLVQYDEHCNPIPAIAGFWEASRDGLDWTFFLRQGVRFHHGREVTAEDFVYSFSRILDPALQSPVAGLFMHIQGAEAFQAGEAQGVEGLQALDRYTLRIRLQQPFAPFLGVLAKVNARVVPREEVERLGDAFGRQPVGSGPFRFVHWNQQQILLQGFEQYYAGPPYLEQIAFKIRLQKTFTDDFQALLAGELDEAAVPGATVDGQPETRSGAYLYLSKPSLHILYLGFNTQLEPFTNPKVRQAFNYAINKDAIVRQIRKRGSIVAQGILPPGMPGYNPALVGYDYNPSRARQLLAEAGYPNGQGLPVIHLWYSSREASAPQEMAAYQAYLAELGVTVEIHQAESWPALEKVLAAGAAMMFRLARHSDIADPDNLLHPLLSSQSKTNRTLYRNPQVDQLLEEARRASDYKQRIALYREIEAMAQRDAPWIVQHHQVFEQLYQPYVRGVEVSVMGAHYIPMKKIWLHQGPAR